MLSKRKRRTVPQFGCSIGKGSTMNSTAMCSTWRGMGPVRLYLARDFHMVKTSSHTIPDRSPPWSTRTAPSTVHQDGGVKHATGASSTIRRRNNSTIGIWNTRTLRAAGKLQILSHEMDRYRWNILGLCEMRWKNFGETTVEKRLNTSMALDFLFTRTS